MQISPDFWTGFYSVVIRRTTCDTNLMAYFLLVRNVIPFINSLLVLRDFPNLRVLSIR